ncbi:conserved Plasmodium membrane protein, unknown function [Plasmodium gallinaceum]|uniref:Uncharacterized protein n=1 Tax=Plasmodium gallinaceum TaxID=5849 RepID=A0A1J1GZ45_PLAGA|nr:conserved Plasmodium membrane protein, unknown function [Plasmodium gallinaceum]CRG96577.1 conserved Plasmodium membrane protein, unknown function [Plasmodium gallinaceum]
MIYLANLKNNDFYYKYYGIQSLLDIDNNKKKILNNSYISNNFTYKKKYKKEYVDAYLTSLEEDNNFFYNKKNNNRNNFKKKTKQRKKNYNHLINNNEFKYFNGSNCINDIYRKNILNKYGYRSNEKRKIRNKRRKQKNNSIKLSKKIYKKKIITNERKTKFFYYLNFLEKNNRKNKFEINKNTHYLNRISSKTIETVISSQDSTINFKTFYDDNFKFYENKFENTNENMNSYFVNKKKKKKNYEKLKERSGLNLYRKSERKHLTYKIYKRYSLISTMVHEMIFKKKRNMNIIEKNKIVKKKFFKFKRKKWKIRIEIKRNTKFIHKKGNHLTKQLVINFKINEMLIKNILKYIIAYYLTLKFYLNQIISLSTIKLYFKFLRNYILCYFLNNYYKIELQSINYFKNSKNIRSTTKLIGFLYQIYEFCDNFKFIEAFSKILINVHIFKVKYGKLFLHFIYNYIDNFYIMQIIRIICINFYIKNFIKDLANIFSFNCYKICFIIFAFFKIIKDSLIYYFYIFYMQLSLYLKNSSENNLSEVCQFFRNKKSANSYIQNVKKRMKNNTLMLLKKKKNSDIQGCIKNFKYLLKQYQKIILYFTNILLYIFNENGLLCILINFNRIKKQEQNIFLYFFNEYYFVLKEYFKNTFIKTLSNIIYIDINLQRTLKFLKNSRDCIKILKHNEILKMLKDCFNFEFFIQLNCFLNVKYFIKLECYIILGYNFFMRYYRKKKSDMKVKSLTQIKKDIKNYKIAFVIQNKIDGKKYICNIFLYFYKIFNLIFKCIIISSCDLGIIFNNFNSLYTLNNKIRKFNRLFSKKNVINLYNNILELCICSATNREKNIYSKIIENIFITKINENLSFHKIIRKLLYFYFYNLICTFFKIFKLYYSKNQKNELKKGKQNLNLHNNEILAQYEYNFFSSFNRKITRITYIDILIYLYSIITLIDRKDKVKNKKIYIIPYNIINDINYLRILYIYIFLNFIKFNYIKNIFLYNNVIYNYNFIYNISDKCIYDRKRKIYLNSIKNNYNSSKQRNKEHNEKKKITKKIKSKLNIRTLKIKKKNNKKINIRKKYNNITYNVRNHYSVPFKFKVVKNRTNKINEEESKKYDNYDVYNKNNIVDKDKASMIRTNHKKNKKKNINNINNIHTCIFKNKTRNELLHINNFYKKYCSYLCENFFNYKYLFNKNIECYKEDKKKYDTNIKINEMRKNLRFTPKNEHLYNKNFFTLLKNNKSIQIFIRKKNYMNNSDYMLKSRINDKIIDINHKKYLKNNSKSKSGTCMYIINKKKNNNLISLSTKCNTRKRNFVNFNSKNHNFQYNLYKNKNIYNENDRKKKNYKISINCNKNFNTIFILNNSRKYKKNSCLSKNKISIPSKNINSFYLNKNSLIFNNYFLRNSKKYNEIKRIIDINKRKHINEQVVEINSKIHLDKTPILNKISENYFPNYKTYLRKQDPLRLFIIKNYKGDQYTFFNSKYGCPKNITNDTMCEIINEKNETHDDYLKNNIYLLKKHYSHSDILHKYNLHPKIKYSNNASINKLFLDKDCNHSYVISKNINNIHEKTKILDNSHNLSKLILNNEYSLSNENFYLKNNGIKKKSLKFKLKEEWLNNIYPDAYISNKDCNYNIDYIINKKNKSLIKKKEIDVFSYINNFSVVNNSREKHYLKKKLNFYINLKNKYRYLMKRKIYNNSQDKKIDYHEYYIKYLEDNFKNIRNIHNKHCYFENIYKSYNFTQNNKSNYIKINTYHNQNNSIHAFVNKNTNNNYKTNKNFSYYKMISLKYKNKVKNLYEKNKEFYKLLNEKTTIYNMNKSNINHEYNNPFGVLNRDKNYLDNITHAHSHKFKYLDKNNIYHLCNSSNKNKKHLSVNIYSKNANEKININNYNDLCETNTTILNILKPLNIVDYKNYIYNIKNNTKNKLHTTNSKICNINSSKNMKIYNESYLNKNNNLLYEVTNIKNIDTNEMCSVKKYMKKFNIVENFDFKNGKINEKCDLISYINKSNNVNSNISNNVNINCYSNNNNFCCIKTSNYQNNNNSNHTINSNRSDNNSNIINKYNIDHSNNDKNNKNSNNNSNNNNSNNNSNNNNNHNNSNNNSNNNNNYNNNHNNNNNNYNNNHNNNNNNNDDDDDDNDENKNKYNNNNNNNNDDDDDDDDNDNDENKSKYNNNNENKNEYNNNDNSDCSNNKTKKKKIKVNNICSSSMHKNMKENYFNNYKNNNYKKKTNIDIMNCNINTNEEKKTDLNKNDNGIDKNYIDFKKDKNIKNLREPYYESMMHNCNALKRYLNYLKNLDYDIKFGNVYVKLKKKLSSQNKCQFEVYEAEIVAIDNICNFFYPHIHNFENFYNLLKKSINNYDFHKISMNNYDYLLHNDINENNINDFMKNSQDFNLIISDLINTIFCSNYNFKCDSKFFIDNTEKDGFSYTSFLENYLTKSLNKEYTCPIDNEITKNFDKNKIKNINDNLNLRKKKNCIISALNNKNIKNDIKDIFPFKIVNMKKNNIIDINNEDANSIQKEKIINTDNFYNSYIFYNNVKKNKNNLNSNFSNNKNTCKSCSIIKNEKEIINGYENSYSANYLKMNSRNINSNIYNSTNNANTNVNNNDSYFNISDKNALSLDNSLFNKQLIIRYLIEVIKKINFLKNFGYESLYDILKEKYIKFLLEKDNVESNTLFNIIKHIIRYNYINDVINNPFTIYQNSIRNIPSNKFAIKILNIDSCNIFKLKYKIHSLLSEGKQLKSVNTEIMNYLEKKNLLKEKLINSNKNNEIIFNDNFKYDNYSLKSNKHLNLSFNSYPVYYQKLCNERNVINNATDNNSKVMNVNFNIDNKINDWKNNNKNNIIIKNKNNVINNNYIENDSNIVDNKNINNKNSINSNSNVMNINNSHIDDNNKLFYPDISEKSSNAIDNSKFPFICKQCLNIFYDKDIILLYKLNKNSDISILSNDFEINDKNFLFNDNIKKNTDHIENFNYENNIRNAKVDDQIKANGDILEINNKKKNKKVNNENVTKKKIINENINLRKKIRNEKIKIKQKRNKNQTKKIKNKKDNEKCSNKKETKLIIKNINKKKKRILSVKKKKYIKNNVKKNYKECINEKENIKINYVSMNSHSGQFIPYKLESYKTLPYNLIPYKHISCSCMSKNHQSCEYLINNYISCNSFNFFINNLKNIKFNLCKKCQVEKEKCENYLTKEIKKKYSNSIPKYLWSSIGVTKNNEDVLGVAMQMIDGCTLTYIIQKLKGTDNVNYGLFLLDICKKLVKHLMIICESIDNPIINWDTKPGNIMIEYEMINSKISCKNVTIIDIGDALPGRSFFFPTNPSYYEKIKINNVQKNFNNFLYYVICTKGYCSPECALLVFLLSSLNKSDQFRKTWYGSDSDIYHINKTKQLRIKYRWKKLLELCFIQAIVKKKEYSTNEKSLHPIYQKSSCIKSGDNNTSSIITQNNDSKINNSLKKNVCPYLFYKNASNYWGDYNNMDYYQNHYNNMSNYKKNCDSDNVNKYKNNYNNMNNYKKNFDNNMSPLKDDCNNVLKENSKNINDNCEFKEGYIFKETNKILNSNLIQDERLKKKQKNDDLDDILKDYYLNKVCTHDINDDNSIEHYSDNEEIKEYLYKKEKEKNETESKLNDSEKKKKKKKECENLKSPNIDTWIIKFTTKTTIFSVGLVLCQLFGGQNLLNIVNKNEVKVVDILCEWNCKNSTNIYSGEKNITIKDLLPTKGIFSNNIWKHKIKKIIKKCLQFIPSRRCTFKELYIDLKNLKNEFEEYYNLNDSSTITS